MTPTVQDSLVRKRKSADLTSFPLMIEGFLGPILPRIKWLGSGKPIIEGLGTDNIDISLSHDEQFCLGVSGRGPQGCDIVPITPRSWEDWLALLSLKREFLLAQLTSQGSESIDYAGTRIWSALEALHKATQAQEIDLKLDRIQGDSVLFQGTTERQSLYVLTVPLLLNQHLPRMIAVIVKKTAAPEFFTRVSSSPLELKLRWPICYKETANVSQTVYFSHFFTWMGQVRDWAVRPISTPLGDYLQTGRWAMVTNKAHLEVIQEIRLNDLLEIRFGVSTISGSTVDFYYHWFKVLPGDICEPVAQGQLQMTWVELFADSGAKPQPFPDFLADFIQKLYNPKAVETLIHESSTEPELYRVNYPVEKGKLLRQERFITSLEEADAIGNINFAAYGSWQGRLRDQFSYSLIPEFYRRFSSLGEFRCRRSHIEYLREALPFEDIQISMTLRGISERGMTLGYEYFRLDSSGNTQKLAVAEHEALWFKADSQGNFAPSCLPEVVKQALFAAAGLE
jgi:acyl-CoA thioesterase FadM/phosphopantetheinyl transferase